MRMFPIEWPRDFDEFVAILSDTFGYVPPTGVFVFDDASSHNVHVCNAATFYGLVPRYVKVDPDIQVFFVGIDIG